MVERYLTNKLEKLEREIGTERPPIHFYTSEYLDIEELKRDCLSAFERGLKPCIIMVCCVRRDGPSSFSWKDGEEIYEGSVAWSILDQQVKDLESSFG